MGWLVVCSWEQAPLSSGSRSGKKEKSRIQQELGNMYYLKRNSIENGRVPNDYQVKMKRLGDKAHFYDHKGQFISSTGHLIDDYALPVEEDK